MIRRYLLYTALAVSLLAFMGGAAPAESRTMANADAVAVVRSQLRLYFRETGKQYVYNLWDTGIKFDGVEITDPPIGWSHVHPALYYDAIDGAASVQIMNTRRRNYPNFRKGYDIVSGPVFSPLFYDKQTGTAKAYNLDLSDNRLFYGPKEVRLGRPVYSSKGWRKGWDIIQPLAGRGKLTPMLFYDRQAGLARIYDFPYGEKHYNPKKPMKLLYETKSWRKTWHSIVPYVDSGVELGGDIINAFVRAKKILFYDNVAGEGHFYEWDEKKTRLGKRIDVRKGWRKTWDTVAFYSRGKKSFILFHDNDTGDVNIYELDKKGKMARRVQ